MRWRNGCKTAKLCILSHLIQRERLALPNLRWEKHLETRGANAPAATMCESALNKPSTTSTVCLPNMKAIKKPARLCRKASRFCLWSTSIMASRPIYQMASPLISPAFCCVFVPCVNREAEVRYVTFGVKPILPIGVSNLLARKAAATLAGSAAPAFLMPSDITLHGEYRQASRKYLLDLFLAARIAIVALFLGSFSKARRQGHQQARSVTRNGKTALCQLPQAP